MMNKQILLIALVCFFFNAAISQVIYVKEGANGTGKSWESAFGDLQDALQTAQPGQQIWVAEGKYFPVICEFCNVVQRQISFVLPNDVKVFGGFAGDEKSLNQRRWNLHPTTLSGNIGTDEPTDNSFNVIYTKNASEQTVLDGFVIADGNADGWDPSGSRTVAGAGWYNDGNGFGNQSNPTIRNCVFLNNNAVEGAALFNNGASGEASPSIEDCTFVTNKAIRGGGAILANGEKGRSDLTIKNCKFVNNEAGFGGAIFAVNIGGTSEQSLYGNHFVNNKATAGSVLFTLGFDKNRLPEFVQCTFLNNQSGEGDLVWHCEGNQLPKTLMANLTVQTSFKL